MTINKLEGLPKYFIIKALRNKKTNVWIAQIENYDICTEADSFYELVINVNDLIYTYFDIPKKLQSQIRYLPPMLEQYSEEKKKTSIEEQVRFTMLVNPSLLANSSFKS